jgi:ATP-binding cassette subfamily B protein
LLRFLQIEDIRESFSRDRVRLLRALAAFIGRAVLALAGPYFLGEAVDRIVRDDGFPLLVRTLILILVFAIATAFCQWWMRWLWIGWSRDVEQRMRDGLFRHLLRLPMTFFDRHRIGDLLSRMTSDMEAIRMGYGPGIMHCVQPIIMTVGALILMLLRSPALTGIALIPMASLFLAMKLLLPKIHERSLRVQERQAELSTRAQESFSGARVIQAFAREAHEQEQFRRLSLATMEDSLSHARIRGLFHGLIEGFAGIGLLMILAFAGREVIHGNLSLGDFARFQGYLSLLIWPMIALGWTLSLFQRAEAAAERVTQIRAECALSVDGNDVDTQPPLQALRVEVRNLTFTHEQASVPSLRGLSLEIPEGTTLGIVGATGSGKTTLVQLLTRLYDPPAGTIFLNGQDLLTIPLPVLRRSIAVVPQESFLFSDTLASNIAFGRAKASPMEIRDAAERSQLLADESVFRDGLDTEVGERGVTLSGGQRQRTSIARGLLMNAPLLILDDALSAVDTETERAILRNLKPLLKQRTSIIISHRLSAVADADRIVVLKDGALVESGTHRELLELRGTYARLWRIQQDEDALEVL